MPEKLLQEYNRKRDFKKTLEPQGKPQRKANKHLVFVVQKHDARRLHYDFRLECNGVLLSWAVPKGPSLDPREKRLAIQTEDHPFDYKDFEGIIPEKQYGAGEVIVWDKGNFWPEEAGTDLTDVKRAEKQITKGLKEGKLSFVLNGERLKGAWTLVKLKSKDNEWLLLKQQDDYADEDKDVTEFDTSVVSGKSLDDLKSRTGDYEVRVWRSNRDTTSSSNPAKKPARSASFPRRGFQPMLDGGTRTMSSKDSKSKSKAKSKSEKKSGEIAVVLEQIDEAGNTAQIEIGEHTVSISNFDKELFPGNGKDGPLTKRDYIRYLVSVSEYLLPHLHGRPITLIRYPNGINGKRFFQKHWEHKLPEFVETVDLFSEHNSSDGEYILCENLPTLVWLGQLADLELHTTHTRTDPEPDGHNLPTEFTGSLKNIDESLMNYPDFVVLDLDPYIYSGKESKGEEPELNKSAFRKTCEIALFLKEALDGLKLSSFVKTSGKTGLHIYLPIVRNVEYDIVRTVAETIGRHLLKQKPNEVTMDWAVVKRTGKIFFDHNMNARGKTLPSPYSARNSVEAAVSTPLDWSELEKVYPTEFTIKTVPARLEKIGDIWADILDHKVDLTNAIPQAVNQPAKKKRRA